MWEFPKIRGAPYFGVLIIRILLFRVLDVGPLFSEIPMYGPEYSRSPKVGNPIASILKSIV